MPPLPVSPAPSQGDPSSLGHRGQSPGISLPRFPLTPQLLCLAQGTLRKPPTAGRAIFWGRQGSGLPCGDV